MPDDGAVRILGVDPGSRATGWAALDVGASPRLIGAGVLRPPTHLPFAERLLALHRLFGEVLERVRPDVAAVERIFSGVNSQSLITLGEARGVLLLALAGRGIPVAELTPAEIKRAVTGSGGAEKEQVRRMVGALLGMSAATKRLSLDAADAAAAALTYGFLSVRRGVRMARPVAEAGGGAAERPPLKRRPSG